MGKRTKKRRVGRPSTGVRPSIAIRVHQELYDELCGTAARAQRSISEEAERRLQVVPIWERQFGSTKELYEQNLKNMAADDRAFLLGKGYQPFSTSRGKCWAEPGVDLLSGPLSIDVEWAAALQKAMPKILEVIVSEMRVQAKEKGLSDASE